MGPPPLSEDKMSRQFKIQVSILKYFLELSKEKKKIIYISQTDKHVSLQIIKRILFQGTKFISDKLFNY